MIGLSNNNEIATVAFPKIFWELNGPYLGEPNTPLNFSEMNRASLRRRVYIHRLARTYVEYILDLDARTTVYRC
jgi:hypothetical protein